MTAAHLRVARESDLPAIAAIYDEAVAEAATADTEAPSLEEQRAWYAAHAPDQHPVIVAEIEGEVAAWLSFSPHRPGRGAVAGAVEISYYVRRDRRRLGLARRLLADALERCPLLGFHTAFAILLADNAPSIALLREFGFAEWGRLPGVARFGGRRVDHLYMGIELD